MFEILIVAMFVITLNLVNAIQAIMPIPVKTNFYQEIISWDYKVVDTTKSTGDCLKWKVLDLGIKDFNDKKQYLFIPLKDSDNNISDYDDWINNVNKDDCIKKLKDDYTWDFELYKIKDDGLRFNDGTHNLIIWKYILDN